MRTLANPQEFCRIHEDDKSFLEIDSNFRMRQFLSSYGFRAPREMADMILNIRAEQK